MRWADVEHRVGGIAQPVRGHAVAEAKGFPTRLHRRAAEILKRDKFILVQDRHCARVNNRNWCQWTG